MIISIRPDNTRREKQITVAATDPYSGSSLLPMLVSGLVLIVVGMIVALVKAPIAQMLSTVGTCR